MHNMQYWGHVLSRKLKIGSGIAQRTLAIDSHPSRAVAAVKLGNLLATDLLYLDVLFRKR